MLTSLFASLEDLQVFLSESSEEQFQNALPQFSLAELTESFRLLQNHPALEPEKKLKKLFQFIDHPTTLETFGRSLSLPSFLNFLEFLTQNSSYQNRLSLILTGLSPFIFSQALHFFQENHLHLLKQEGSLEPLQYQLTQFIHEGESLKQHIEQTVQQYQKEITLIQPQELTQKVWQELTQKIDDFRNQLLDYLERASTALAIVWHTDRLDLIDKLSSINEAIQHHLTSLIGHPNFDNLPATGLYSFLEKNFSNVFDSSLNDEDAAIEGMTRLSIWHLKDYWELGLLPSIHHLNELDLNPEKHSEIECYNHHQYLISVIQKQLENLGIGTVGNLKKSHLFSKELLKAYIKQHHQLLI